MKTFYGGVFISKVKLKEANIYNPIKLEYYKIKDEKENKEEYGIEIIKTEYAENKVLTESKSVNNITDDENIANNVLELFKRNEVTPVAANEIIEDLFKM